MTFTEQDRERAALTDADLDAFFAEQPGEEAAPPLGARVARGLAATDEDEPEPSAVRLITPEYAYGCLIGWCLNRPNGTWQLFWTRREAETQARKEGLMPIPATPPASAAPSDDDHPFDDPTPFAPEYLAPRPCPRCGYPGACGGDECYCRNCGYGGIVDPETDEPVSAEDTDASPPAARVRAVWVGLLSNAEGRRGCDSRMTRIERRQRAIARTA